MSTATADGATSPLQITLFGPFHARMNGRPLPRLHSRKGQWLLALLALRGGRSVERAWLAGTLWPDSPDPDALANLRNSLKDLRKALGSLSSRLLSPTTRTLALGLEGVEVDVVAFDAAITRDDLSSLEQVIALYRGPLLEGCTEEWVLQERQSREQAYLTALEALAARTWVAGERAVAERYLRLAVAADPLRETAQRALMQALAEGGNAAAALLVYRELRLLLHRELNTVPDPETTVLFHSLRSQTRQPASAPEGETGRSVQAASDQRRSNLPVPPTALIGRERELDTVGQLLLRDEVRLVTLTGPPGTGKTRLGLEIAANLLSSFDEGARFVSLAPLQNPSLVVSTIGHSLGVRESGGRSPMESLKEYLQEKELLLLLDNFEQVLNSPAATTPPL